MINQKTGWHKLNYHQRGERIAQLENERMAVPLLERCKMKRRQWKVHAIMECQECEWEDQDWQHSVRNARNHAKATGHEIHGETGYAVRYNEKTN